MARYPARRSRGGSARISIDPATALHDAAVKLFDKGDGHGADWAAAAEASFRCAFAFLHNVPADDPRAGQIARRVHDFAYGMMVGSPDRGAPYTAGGKPSRLIFTMTDPAPEHAPKR